MRPVDPENRVADRDVITDQMWEWMEPLLPSSDGKRGGQWRDHRLMVEAICWRLRTGAPWRDLPERFGPWQTAWYRFDRWCADGTWARLLEVIQAHADQAGQLGWDVSVDSTVVRAHQHAAGARTADGDDTGGSGESQESAVRAA